MPEVIYAEEDIVEVKPVWLDRLKREAAVSPRKRARLCLHRDENDRVHEMVIVMIKGTLIAPHRHVNKSESFHIIEGDLVVLIFDPSGRVVRHIAMGPPGSGKTFFYRLSTSDWHSVVPVSETVAFHETTAGPFVRGSAEPPPPWGPRSPEEWLAWLDQAARAGSRKL
ncbi:MAG: cupin fold metalloprotein, WbuC family [Nitrospirae bacterium]|nr:cupin fold metalloprotein, WbuC family [Nitrospirota bacterium]